MNFTEEEILEELDFAFQGVPGKFYPRGNEGDIKYNFFLDLEHGYCITAGNRIHLYSDDLRWAIVFEMNGYFNRSFNAAIQLDYVGNCINYPIQHSLDQKYISNCSRIILIEEVEFERIKNDQGSDMERFELVGQDTKEIKVGGVIVPFEKDPSKYEKLGIKIRDFDNPRQLIGFGDLIRYLNETNPALVSATEDDIRSHIPLDLPKLMTISSFHFGSVYDQNNLPSKQETYQLIAKVLLSREPQLWKPSLNANNHWSNWESGGL